MTTGASRDARSEEQTESSRSRTGTGTGTGTGTRPKTMSRREMLREKRRRERAGDLLEIIPYDRPSNRSQCANGPRPCLYVACKYHLFLDVNPETGSIKINFPDKNVWELEQTCSLDVAERGGVTLEEVGDILNLTRERVRQIEAKALRKMRHPTRLRQLQGFLDGEGEDDQN